MNRETEMPVAETIVPDHDAELELLVPEGDVTDPELSIVIPALNEEAVIDLFMDWCHEGIAKAGVVAEVLIIDSSTDLTPEIALAKGARVLKAPKRGLGRAYIDAVSVIRGKYVIMGDADCTYDFREIAPFLERFREGCEFVMGSRFAGSIEAGAMPALHRYFGTPLTGFILNAIYGTRFTDIHCGMRGMPLDVLKRMRLRSQSWEYASEIVVKSVRLGLKTVEVPVHFYKDRDGRVSHHKRLGWFSPWQAGWINLRAMLVHGADFFVMKPGALALLLGLLLMLPLGLGPMDVFGVTLSLNTMLIGLTAAVLGLASLCIGVVARNVYDTTGEVSAAWRRRLRYTPTAIATGFAFVLGAVLLGLFVLSYVAAGYRVDAAVLPFNHLAVWGLLLMIGSFLVFVSALVIHALGAYPRAGD